MKQINKLKPDTESTANKDEAKRTLLEDSTFLDDEKLGAVSGGYGADDLLNKNPQCKCSGEPVDMTFIGTDSTEHFSKYQCPLCNKTRVIFGKRIRS